MTNENYKLPALEVIALLPDVVKSNTEIVGRWVWVKFETKPGQEIISLLKDLGFHWNQNRKTWQHSGGFPTLHSPGNPKDKYQVVKADDLVTA